MTRCLLSLLALGLASLTLAADWPDLLLIDDFAAGAAKWTHDDTGILDLADGPRPGVKALRWTSTDDSVGQVIFRDLDRATVDFSQYDLLVFEVKIDGRPIWNLNPILQQYPAVYGFRGLYYSIDTMHPFGRWFTWAQDLSRWENAPPDSFDAAEQEFRFEVQQLAGAGQTQIHLANLRLVKNPLGLKPSYQGTWGALPDGTQVTHFEVELSNRRDRVLTVQLGIDPEHPGTLRRFRLDAPGEAIRLLPGERRTVGVAMVVPAAILAELPAWYGETARLAARIAELPGLVLHTQLVAGTRPPATAHPSILCDPVRMKQLHAEYGNPAKRAELAPALLRLVTQGDAALAFEPAYPPLAHGRTTDPVSGAKLVKIEVPNLSFSVYQDPTSGRTYSGPLYDAGMEGWERRHLDNAANAQTLAVAWLVSGRREFALAAARILRAYIDRYPELPVTVYEHGSPTGSACSGSVRIGGTYMRERVWLTHLAVALDSIRSAGVLSDDEVRAIGERVFVPSASNMMDHQVGVMNLQFQIDSAVLYAGLAAGEPGLAARSLYDSHGILRLLELGYLADGNWWENPSYQNVAGLCAYPAMAVCLRNGIIAPSERQATILTSFYRLAAPDGFSPELGTGGGRNAALDDTAAHVFAPLIPDPRLAWLAYRRKPAHYVGETYLMAVVGARPPLVPEAQAISPVATETVHFPDYGGLALRLPGSDAYCYFHYGREVTHGHRNKLSIQAYGKGGWYVRNVMGGYNHNFKDFLETIASSTSIMVDGRNARSDTGTLLLHRTEEGIEIASARENGAWPDADHVRTVVLTRGPLIVLDRCRADSERTYDWLYHANWCGFALDTAAPLSAAPERLGETSLYSGLRPAGRFPAVGAVAWKRENGSGMKMAMLPRGELFHTRVTDAIRPSEGLLWRQRGTTVDFAAVLWPHARDEAGQPALEWLTAVGDRIGCRVTTPEGAWTVAIDYAAATPEVSVTPAPAP